MEEFKGRIKISNKGSGVIKAGKNARSIPRKFKFSKEKHHGKDAIAYIENNQIVAIKIDGVSLEIDEAIAEEKAKQVLAKEAREKRQTEIAKREKEMERRLQKDIFDLDAALIPSDTQRLEISKAAFVNYGLKLNKFAYYSSDERNNIGKFQLSFKDKYMQPNFYDVPIKEIANKHIQQIKHCFKDVRNWEMQMEGKMAIGLGEASVYETNITLHPLYGFPYIPASAIKGVLRNHLIEKYTSEDQIGKPGMEAKAFSKENGENAKRLCDIFGATDILRYKKKNGKTDTKDSFYREAKAGKIIFCDAYPLELNEHSVVSDVMTPHFGDYYQGKVPPVDHLTPTPIPFLVSQGIPFIFTLAASKNCDETILDFTKQELISAMSEKGIGAKSAIGYGYFELSQNSSS